VQTGPSRTRDPAPETQIYAPTISGASIKRAKGREKEEYFGSFCALCGKKAGRCRHRRPFFYLGEHGEFVVAE
jgi:hypothetical protein